MALFDFWKSMGAARKAGLVLSAVLVAGMVGGGAYWLLNSEYESVVHSTNPDKVAAAVREIERIKVPYRVSDDGSTVEVPRAKLGHVRVSLAGGASGTPSTGFELFNNTDFSTTEFTQKINYQRALQGELVRTVSTIEGVASARVHIVLPDSGFLRRKSVVPTAAVNVVMNPGKQLTAGQVFGIQKLVAASVPEIKVDDITVLDQDGISLTKNKTGADQDLVGRGQLELKREVDVYLESKLKRLLATLDPEAEFSVSVDATLNNSDSKITTEEVLPAEGVTNKSVGVVVRERLSQRHDGVTVPESTGAASSPTSGSVVREVEYKVGHRVEQVATAPGGIARISVAVLARSGSLQTDASSLKSLVVNAIGAKEEDGDTIAVVVLPPAPSSVDAPVEPSVSKPLLAPASSAVAGHPPGRSKDVLSALAWLLGFGVVALMAWLLASRRHAVKATPAALSDGEVDQIVNRIHAWLENEPTAANS
jgi:flagellar M-ring protein FliF